MNVKSTNYFQGNLQLWNSRMWRFVDLLIWKGSPWHHLTSWFHSFNSLCSAPFFLRQLSSDPSIGGTRARTGKSHPAAESEIVEGISEVCSSSTSTARWLTLFTLLTLTAYCTITIPEIFAACSFAICQLPFTELIKHAQKLHYWSVQVVGGFDLPAASLSQPSMYDDLHERLAQLVSQQFLDSRWWLWNHLGSPFRNSHVVTKEHTQKHTQYLIFLSVRAAPFKLPELSML